MVRRFLPILTVALLGTAGLSTYFVLAKAEPAPAYRLARVEEGALVSSITATGALSALVTVEVGSQLSGQIAELNADFNSQVREGQVLARLNGDQLDARLAQARADLEAARATLNQQVAQLDKARADVANAKANVANAAAQILRSDLALRDADRDLARRQELRGRGVVSTSDLEKTETAARTARAQLASSTAQRQQAEAGLASAEATLEVSNAQVQVARAQVAQREAALQLVEVDVKRSVIRSPIDGVVVNRAINIGQTVAASLSAPTLFTIAQDLRQMEVLANINEADIGRVREGLPVRFTVTAFPGEVFSGTVSQVRLAPNQDQNVVTYIAVITVENPGLRLLPGMTANLSITVNERDRVLKLPNAALRFRPPGVEAPADALAPTPTLGGPSGGRGAQALAALVTALSDELKLDESKRKELGAIVGDARDRFAALGSEAGDPERRRAEARDVRARAEQRIAAVLAPPPRDRFAALGSEAGDPERRRAEARDVRARAEQRIAAALAPAQRDRFEAILANRAGGETARTVWVPGAQGTPVGVPVRLGISDGSFTEVVSGGLAAGQDVIVGVAQPDRSDNRRGPRLGF
ncbi:efflux RND transporter periplasmic adaptor subunit [Azospirillum sp. sgz302134]